jgi:hypothetical protein
MNTGPSELQKAIARALHGYDDEDEDEPETIPAMLKRTMMTHSMSFYK